MDVEHVLNSIKSFIEGFKRENEVDINNGVFIAKELFHFEIPFHFRDGGRLGIESLELYSLFDVIPKRKVNERDEKAYEVGKELSKFSSRELRLMASFLWNEGKSSLFPEERVEAADLIKEYLQKTEKEIEIPVKAEAPFASVSST